jgi:hypothetical protein
MISSNSFLKRGFMSRMYDLPFARPVRLLLLMMLISLARLASAQTPAQGSINTIAGGATSSTICSGALDSGGDGCLATQAVLNTPYKIAVDSSGNIYTADSVSATIRFVYEGGTVPYVLKAQGITPTVGNIYIVAGIYGETCGANDGGGEGNPSTCGDGGLATQAYLGEPVGVVLDSSDNLYIVDEGEEVVREVSAATGYINRIAGTYYAPGAASTNASNTLATSATLKAPQAVAVDQSGNIFIADEANDVIRMIYEGGTVPAFVTALGISPTQGAIYIVAGRASAACSKPTASPACGDTGLATSAMLNTPYGVFVDSNENIFIADRSDERVRVVYGGVEPPPALAVATSSPTAGSIYTIAGTGAVCTTAPCGDGSSAADAPVRLPNDVSVDSAGNAFISDGGDFTVREIEATSGEIEDVAGTERASGFSGAPGPATSALLSGPIGIALDRQGNLYISDETNSVIQEVYGVAAATLTAQTINFDQSLPTVTYGASPITLTATASSGLAVTYTVTGPATISSSTLTVTGAGDVTVTANQAGSSSYSAATPVSQSFTVNPATVTVAANNISVPYGTTLGAGSLTYTVTGLVGADTTTGTPTLTANGYTTTSAVGTTYTINVVQGGLAISPTSQANSYTFHFQSGTLTVAGGSSQTINFPTLSGPFVYGMKPISLNATSSADLPIAYTVSGPAVVTGSASTGYALTITGAGTVTVTANQAGNSQYGPATPASQVLQIARATITVAATNLSVPYGTVASSLAFADSITGLVGSDITTGAAAFSTTYTNTSPVGGMYSITPSLGTLAISPSSSASNYIFNFVLGTLTVTQTANTISFSPLPSVTYGVNSVVMSATSSSGLPVSYTVLSGPATVTGNTLYLQTAAAVTGVGTVVVQATQAGNTNYAAATPVTQNLTIQPAVLTVTASSYTIAPGATQPVFNYIITGFMFNQTNTPAIITGLPAITTSATTLSPAGTYPIVITQGTLAPVGGNYTFQFVNGILTIEATPAFSVTANPSTVTVQAGQTAQTTVVLTPVNIYQGTVTLSCQNLPVNVTCTFSPATVTLVEPTGTSNSQPVQTTLTINTNASSPMAGMVSPGNHSRVLAASLFVLPGGLGGLLLAFHRKRLLKHKRMHALLILLILLSGVMGLNACAGGSMSSLATPGTDIVTIVATGAGGSGTGSPNVTNTISLTVDVTSQQVQ